MRIVVFLTLLLILSSMPLLIEVQSEDGKNSYRDWVRDQNHNGIDDVIEYEMSLGKERTNIFVEYNHRPDKGDIERLESFDLELKYVYRYIDVICARNVSISDIQSIAKLPNVIMVCKEEEVYPVMDVASRSLRARNSTQYYPFTVWDELGFEGENVSIAILDSGVDDQVHEGLDDLDDNPDTDDPKFLAGVDWTKTVVITDGSFNPDDVDGHGTHVAGIAMGTGDGAGNGEYRGIAPKARLVDVKVIEDWGSGTMGEVINGIEWCIEHKDDARFDIEGQDIGIDILSMSIGTTYNDDGTSPASQAVNAAVDAGLIVIVAIGNDDNGNNARVVPPPASADKAIVVGAVDDHDSVNRDDDSLAPFSYTGPRNSDGDSDPYDELKPDVVAPGVDIFSCLANSFGSYVALSGTSMSCPMVTGTVALMLEANPSLRKTGSDVASKVVREILHETAEDRDGTYDDELSGKYDTGYGWGIVDAYGAVKRAMELKCGTIDGPDEVIAESTVLFSLTYNYTRTEYTIEEDRVHFNVSVPSEWSMPKNLALSSDGNLEYTTEFTEPVLIDDKWSFEGSIYYTGDASEPAEVHPTFQFQITMPSVTEDTNYTLYSEIDLNGMHGSSLSHTIKVIYNPNAPDLYTVPNWLTFSNYEPEEEEKVIIYAIVENKGNLDAENVTVRFYCDLVVIDNIIIEHLEVDEQAEISTEWIAIRGVHNINIMIDPDYEILELDETNNYAGKSIDVIAYGVEMTATETEKDVTKGDSAIYNITVRNTGNRDDSIILTKSSLPAGWGAELSDTKLDLKEEEAESITLTVHAPLNASHGERAVLTITASSESNPEKEDSLTFTTTVFERKIEIEITGIELEGTLSKGGTKDYTLTVRNRGNMEDNILLSRSVEIEGWSASIELNGKKISSIKLNADESASIVLSVSAPSDALPGEACKVIVTARSENDTGKKDSVTTTTTVEGEKPDLIVKGVTFFREKDGKETNNPIEDEHTKIKAVIGNDGSADAVNVLVEFYDDGSLIDSSTVTIPMNDEREVETTWVAEQGEHELRIIVDPENEIPEEDERNNELSESVNVKGKSATDPFVISGQVHVDNSPKENVTVEIENLRTSSSATVMTKENGSYWYVLNSFNEGDEIEVRALYEGESDSQKIFAYSEDGGAEIDLYIYISEFGVELTCEDALHSVMKGYATDFIIIVENKGSAQDTFDLTVFLPENWSAEFPNGEEIYSITLNDDESESITLTIITYQYAEAKDYPIIVNATSRNDATKNCSLILTVIIESKEHYEIVLKLIDDEEKHLDAGGTVLFNISVKNRGNVPDIITFEIQGIKEQWSAILKKEGNEISEIELNAGGSAILTVEVISPPNAVYGEEIEIEVKAVSQGDDSQLSSVKITAVIDVLAEIDLTIKLYLDDEKITQEGMVKITARVYNDGDENIEVTVAIYLIHEENTETYTKLITVKANSYAEVSTEWKLSDKGEYTVIAIVDPEHLIKEKYERNNKDAIEFTVVEQGRGNGFLNSFETLYAILIVFIVGVVLLRRD